MSDYAEPKISRINVCGRPVGLRNLEEALEAVRRRETKDEAELRSALIEAVRGMKNYIPDSAVTKYQKALLREYRRFLGEPFEKDEDEGLVIKILGMGCPVCTRLTEEVMAALTELKIGADVEHVTDVNQIAEYGVIGSPALLINGQVKSVGRVPGRNQIWEWIKDEAEKE